MASTTAEVMLYFGTDDSDFERAVNAIRFSADPPLETNEIIRIVLPIWTVAYDEAYDAGYDEGVRDASY